jgi:hypothetical protein
LIAYYPARQTPIHGKDRRVVDISMRFKELQTLPISVPDPGPEQKYAASNQE